MSHHVSSLASFTWGRLMTDDSQPPFGFVGYRSGAPQDWRNLELEHSVSAQDVRFQFNWQISWDLPIGTGRALNLSGLAKHPSRRLDRQHHRLPQRRRPHRSPKRHRRSLLQPARRSRLRSPLARPPQRRTVARSHPASRSRQTSSFQEPHQPTSPTFVPTEPTAPTSPSTRSSPSPTSETSASRSPPLTSPTPFSTAIQTSSGIPGSATDPHLLTGFGQILSAANQPRQFQFGSRFTF